MPPTREWRRYACAALLLLAGGLATEAASRFIVAHFPDRPLAEDLLLRVLPDMPLARYVTSAAIALGFLLFAIYALSKARNEIPKFAAVIALMYLFRAALMVLTPLANANNGEPAAFPIFQYGMFPSGHTAAMLLVTLFIDAEAAPRLRLMAAGLTVVVAVGMLIAHSHYAIDIAGGAMLAYFIEREWTSGKLFGPLKRLVE